MSIKKIGKEQPESFEFDNKNLESANKVILNYLLKDIGCQKMKFILQ